MKHCPWFRTAMLLALGAAIVYSLRVSPLYAQDRRQLQPQTQPQRPTREPASPRTQPQPLPAQPGVNVEVPTNAANALARAVPTNPVTGPTASEVLHKVEIAGVNLPEDTRVLSPITAHHEVIAVSLPNDARLRLRVGKTQVHTLTLGGQLPVLHSVRDWFKQFGEGRGDRRSMSVIHLDAAGGELQRTNLFEAAPIELTIDITTGTWRLVIAAEHMEID